MEDEKKEVKQKGLIRGVVEVFAGKMKELKPVEAAIAFVSLFIVGSFTSVAMVSAIASAMVKIVQVIGIVSGA